MNNYDESYEERLERLEDFIGNIDQIRLYANSLQEVIDKYLAPLYIESGSDNVMLVDGYLGDLSNIPHNIIFKIRTSHDLVMQPSDPQALIRFKRDNTIIEYTLRKMVDGALVRLDSGNYIAGEVYDVYINSQDVAIITSNDTGVRALSEIAALTTVVNDNYNTLDTKIDSNYNTLDTKINNKFNEAKTYADTQDTPIKNRVTALETKTSAFTKSGNNYTFNGNITTSGTIQAATLRATTTVNFSGVSGFQLPNGCTISDPSANLGIANKQWVTTLVNNSIDAFYARKHVTGTATPTSSSIEKNAYYYKLES